MGAGELTAAAGTHDGLWPRTRDRRPERRARRRVLEPWLVPALTVHDLAAVPLAYALAFAARSSIPLPLTTAVLPVGQAWQPYAALVLLLVTQLPLLYVLGLYDVRLLRERPVRVGGIAAAVAAQLLVVTAWYFFRGEIAFPRSVLLLYAAADVALIALSRAAARSVLVAHGTALRVALVGAAAEITALHQQLAGGAAARHGIELVGAVRPPGPPPIVPSATPAPRWLGATRDLKHIAREHGIEQLIVAPGPAGRDELLESVLQACAGVAGLRVAVLPSVYELRVGRLASLRIDDVPLIEVTADPGGMPSFRVKALVDYVLATLLLALAAPLCLAAALAIRATSPGPVLYRQRRVGRDGREFLIYKLRTMHDDAERATGPVLASDGDRRVTAVGRFLRATRIDEIPQLLNVLNGTMSLVGPRPERPEFADALTRDVAGYRERWLVKPGLSGLAQVRGDYHTSPAYKLKDDLAYIHNHTLLLDLRIMVETMKTLFARRGV